MAASSYSLDELRMTLAAEREKQQHLIDEQEQLKMLRDEKLGTLMGLEENLIKAKCQWRELQQITDRQTAPKRQRTPATVGYPLPTSVDSDGSVILDTESEDEPIPGVLSTEQWQRSALFPAAQRSVEAAAQKDGFPFTTGEALRVESRQPAESYAKIITPRPKTVKKPPVKKVKKTVPASSNRSKIGVAKTIGKGKVKTKVKKTGGGAKRERGESPAAKSSKVQEKKKKDRLPSTSSTKKRPRASPSTAKTKKSTKSTKSRLLKKPRTRK